MQVSHTITNEVFDKINNKLYYLLPLYFYSGRRTGIFNRTICPRLIAFDLCRTM